MCAVSAVTDYYRDKWPLIPMEPIDKPWSGGITITPNPMPLPYTLDPGVWITAEQWKEYQELKRRMEEYDAKTNQPDCVKPEVAEWEAVIEAYLIKRGIIHQNN